MDRIIPGLDPHNVFLACEDYKTSFDDIFKRGGLPTEPSFYLHVPSRVDPTAAPPNKDAITVLVPVAHLRHPSHPSFSADEWSALRLRAKKAVIAVLEKHLGITGFEKMIEVEDVNGPVEWEEKFGLWNGSALGMSHEMFQVTWFRPSTRHAVYGNLFFVGASTHPGTGVPIVLCGAKLVAQQILSCIHRGTFRHAPTPFSTLLSLQSVLLTVFGAMMAAVVWSLMAGVAGVEVVG